MHSEAAKGIRRASTEGSQLEKAIQAGLVQAGYRVEFHREQFLKNDKLQLDLFLPEKNIAIEVDGVMHFQNIYGQEHLDKTKKRDNVKNGLIMSLGITLIRIRQTKELSRTYIEKILDQLKLVLSQLESKELTSGKIITIEVK